MGNLNTIPLGYLNMVFFSLEFIQFNVSGEKRENGSGWWDGMKK
jgi:hypothetical protein